MPMRPILLLFTFAAFVVTAAEPYSAIVLRDKPVAYWRLNDMPQSKIKNIGSAGEMLDGTAIGSVELGSDGPRSEAFPLFESSAKAALFSAHGAHVAIKDSAELRGNQNDSITLEAWIDVKAIADGQNVYVAGKGRTRKSGGLNQNYALRLRGASGEARVSFLFRDAANTQGEKGWHRWTTDAGVAPKSGWHHVAVSYTFGAPESVRGYIDGAQQGGTWDMGGATKEAPVVDDDEFWIGSSMAGSASSSFNGAIAEVAFYRTALAPERLKEHYKATDDAHRVANNDGNDSGPAVREKGPDYAKDLYAPLPSALDAAGIAAELERLQDSKVRVEIVENIAKLDSESNKSATATETYSLPAMGMVCLPVKYNDKGLRADRSSPFAVRMSAAADLPAGENRLLVRTLNGAKLFVDGKLVAQHTDLKAGANGHGLVPADPKKLNPEMRALKAGHRETLVTVPGGKHLIVLVALIGGGKLRPETGEISVSTADAKDGMFTLVGDKNVAPPLTDEAWTKFAEAQRTEQTAKDSQRRHESAVKEEAYWAMRQQLARQAAEKIVVRPPKETKLPAVNDVDRYLNEKIEAAGVTPAAVVDDLIFQRRLALDTTGLIPRWDRIVRRDDNEIALTRREKLIDFFVSDSAWADNWVGYWQDVLAENPGLLKPQLNNTGPFRTWIYESFLDNKPIDRFATELIMMEGSVYGGSPAGFAMASENDAPFTEKAAILGKAFMAAEMKCARCHDAPHHKFVQKDLFATAAMLKRAPQEVPKTSSIPLSEKELGKLSVEVTLKPGSKVEPDWPFEHLIPEAGKVEALHAGVLRKNGDSREKLAALITSPSNTRFAKVIVNRLWKRYMGTGIVEPVDDWEKAKPSHPELLDYLARELMLHDYDLKHVAKLILNSNAYQRTVGRDAVPVQAAVKDDKGTGLESHPTSRLFAAQSRRRMSAEQLADSLFFAAGKTFGSEELNFDVDSQEGIDIMQNLGIPRRAWQFTSLSNERDRPALSLPVAQSIIDVLGRFGWREARQTPLTVRDEAPNVLQPATLANGSAGNRVARLSDDSALTAMCLEVKTPEELLEKLYRRILSRFPSDKEKQQLLPIVSDGFATRVKTSEVKAVKLAAANQVSWSNHLSPEATKIKMELEKAARQGEPPTQRLDPNWREGIEDIIWTLFNSPEFIFIP